MTTQQMLPAIGRKVVVRFEEIEVVCVVRDVKTAWNKARLLIEPEAGSGRQWVEMGRVLRLAMPEWVKDATRGPVCQKELVQSARRFLAGK